MNAAAVYKKYNLFTKYKLLFESVFVKTPQPYSKLIESLMKNYIQSRTTEINDYKDKQLDHVTLLKRTEIFNNLVHIYKTDQLIVLYRKKTRLQLKHGKF